MEKHSLSIQDIDRIIEMAWEDRTSFESIFIQFGLVEKEVIDLMRREMKASSFRMWRKRVNGRTTKHAALRSDTVNRFRCKRQRNITGKQNKQTVSPFFVISKSPSNPWLNGASPMKLNDGSIVGKQVNFIIDH